MKVVGYMLTILGTTMTKILNIVVVNTTNILQDVHRIRAIWNFAHAYEC
jgi:hypothetical protein